MLKFRRFCPPSAYARLKWLKIMIRAFYCWSRKPASGQFRVIVCARLNILLPLMLNQSCFAICPCCRLNPPLRTRKPMILKERREGDSCSPLPCAVCKLQISDCRGSRICQDCRRPLHAIARWDGAVFLRGAAENSTPHGRSYSIG
jgi:hypothetical protein